MSKFIKPSKYAAKIISRRMILNGNDFAKAAYMADAANLPTKKVGGVTVPASLNGDALLKFMKDNLPNLVAEKKAIMKEADGMTIPVDINFRLVIDKDGILQKAADGYNPNLSQAQTVLCVINTTNWMDSHSDVHIPGLWKKCLKENKLFSHLQEHKMMFTHIISDSSKGYTQNMAWKELGYEAVGSTEALIFASPLTGRNEYMEDQYRKGYVKNHSVGMRYVTLKFCVNRPDDEYYKEEYANWVQYIDQVINKEAAEEQGFFWAVLEAKIIEGSAVPVGSNIITPTIGFKSAQPAPTTEKNEPPQGTQVKDEETKEKETAEIDWDKIAKVFTN
jgi:hypothetical protein